VARRGAQLGPEPNCPRCGGLHFGTVVCPYLDRAVCVSCGQIIEAETGSDFSVYLNRRFDELGRVHHNVCKETTAAAILGKGVKG
jgi:ribosomal protein S27AE